MDAPTACPLETADQSSVLGSAEQDAFDENSNVPFHKSKKTGTFKKYYKKYFKPAASENKAPSAGGALQPPSPTTAAPPATSQLSHASSMQDDPNSEVTSEVGRASRQSHRPTAERDGEVEPQDLRGTLKGMFHKRKPSKHIELDAIRQAHAFLPTFWSAQQQQPPLVPRTASVTLLPCSACTPTSTSILNTAATGSAVLAKPAAAAAVMCVPSTVCSTMPGPWHCFGTQCAD